MKRLRNIVIGAVSVFALSALPLHLDLGTLGSYDLSSAQAAKGGNGGGGGGNGNGHSGGNGKGGKAGGSSHATKAGGKSASAADHSRSLFSKGRARSGKVIQKSKSSSQLAEKRGSTSKAKVAKAKPVRTELAALPETMVAPELLATVKEKNLNAKLGRLNSLKRNVNAYINSKSPKFAAVQAFVVASAEADLAQAAADAANAAVTAEQAELDALNAELGALTGLPPAATPEEQAAREAQIAELNAQITEQQAAVTAAEEAAAQAQAAADETALQAALEAMANKPVDDDVMEWAKEVLGFGKEVGKIDEVRERPVRTELAALPETMVAPELLATVKEKNLNAKLGRLNSLKRNVNAYINSQSPKFAAVQAFVVASAEADLAQAAADVANAAVTAEQAELDALNAELGALTGLPPAATPEEQAAREAQIAELNAQITEQQAAVTAAEEAAAQAQAAADEAAEDTDETALQAALESMANKPVDDDVMEWAKEVLGFGGEVGKIDEVRESLEPSN